MEAGNIVIRPFDESKLGPNSYCMHLSDELLVYDEEIIECKHANKTRAIRIPKEGYVLQPGELYLGRTVEYTETNGFVPVLNGRLSLGMLGVTIHITAGFGDNGFKGTWTLEIFCVKPVRIYPGMKICHICYFPVIGDGANKYQGKYMGQQEVRESKIHLDLFDDGAAPKAGSASKSKSATRPAARPAAAHKSTPKGLEVMGQIEKGVNQSNVYRPPFKPTAPSGGLGVLDQINKGRE